MPCIDNCKFTLLENLTVKGGRKTRFLGQKMVRTCQQFPFIFWHSRIPNGGFVPWKDQRRDCKAFPVTWWLALSLTWPTLLLSSRVPSRRVASPRLASPRRRPRCRRFSQSPLSVLLSLECTHADLMEQSYPSREIPGSRCTTPQHAASRKRNTLISTILHLDWSW